MKIDIPISIACIFCELHFNLTLEIFNADIYWHFKCFMKMTCFDCAIPFSENWKMRMNTENWNTTKIKWSGRKCEQSLNVNCFIGSFLLLAPSTHTKCTLCSTGQFSSLLASDELTCSHKYQVAIFSSTFVYPSTSPLQPTAQRTNNIVYQTDNAALFRSGIGCAVPLMSGFDDTDTVITIAAVVIAVAIVVSSIEPTINCYPSGFLGPMFDRDHWHTNRIIHIK